MFDIFMFFDDYKNDTKPYNDASRQLNNSLHNFISYSPEIDLKSFPNESTSLIFDKKQLFSIELLEKYNCFTEAELIVTNNSHSHLYIRMGSGAKYFYGKDSINQKEQVKRFITNKKTHKQIAKIIFEFDEGEEIAMVGKWFNDLSHYLEIYITSKDYEFHILGITLNEHTLLTLDILARKVGIFALLLRNESPDRYKALRSGISIHQLQKAFNANPFPDLDDLK